MAHPQESRDLVRQKYVFEQLPLEVAASFAKIPVATARSWKTAAKQSGDDWDKLRAAHLMAGDGLENIGRMILTGFLVQYQTTIEQINQNQNMQPVEKAQLLGSLADAYNKTVAANKKVLPETNRLAIALETVGVLANFIAQNHPKERIAFVQILEAFKPTLTQEFKE